MSGSDTAFLFLVWRKSSPCECVIAVSSTAETLDKSVCYKLPAKGIACILAATVAVKDSSVESAILLTQLLYTTEFKEIKPAYTNKKVAAPVMGATY